MLGYLGDIYQWRFLMWKQVMTKIWDMWMLAEAPLFNPKE